MASFDFTPPEFWSFPPFFTLQPVEATRSKQLALWKDLILKFHMERNLGSMTLAEFPYFENKAIGRRMDSKGITAVIESLIASGMCVCVCVLHVCMLLECDACMCLCEAWKLCVTVL